MKSKRTQPQEWWAGRSQGERHLIWSVMKLLRGAKRSEVEEVARAAAKWESGIGCFIKVRLMGEKPGDESQKKKGAKLPQLCITVAPAPGHASPNLRRAEARPANAPALTSEGEAETK